MIGVVQVGIGPIGIGVAKLVAQRSGCRIVAAVDPAPDKIGRDLGEVLELPSAAGVTVVAKLADADLKKASVAIVTTGSNLERVAPLLEEVMGAGLHIVSTCEELAYPFKRYPDLSARLDRVARKFGIAMVGTGINPGYVMDVLPILLTMPCAAVDQVRVTRVVDAARRRVPLQKKVGVGITPAEFAVRVEDGTLRHVGLTESLLMIAGALGWELDDISESIEPVVAAEDVQTATGQVPAGAVQGVRQIALGMRSGREVIRLDLAMYAGAPDPVDRTEIIGTPNLVFEAKGGIHGDIATCAIAANLVGQIGAAAPGLRTMSDLSVPRAWGL